MAKRYHDGHYAGAEGRRSQEMRDAGMISEDHGAIANLPQSVKYSAWDSDNNYLNANLDDTIRGIDKQKSEDVSGTKRHEGVHRW